MVESQKTEDIDSQDPQTGLPSPKPSSVEPQQPPSLHERVMAEARIQEALAKRHNNAAQPSAPADAGQAHLAAVSDAVEADPGMRASLFAAGVDTATQPTRVILTEGQTPIMGIWAGNADELATYLLDICPTPLFTVPTAQLAEYYVRYCGEAGLRADLLWAQMIHETGYGRYGGCVRPEQNNFAGIGATGGGEPGLSFPTAEAGVMAHIAHMIAYVYRESPVSWAESGVDPRFDLVQPRGVASVLADLNGRWAVPGTTYGQAIENIARALNSR